MKCSSVPALVSGSVPGGLCVLTISDVCVCVRTCVCDFLGDFLATSCLVELDMLGWIFCLASKCVDLSLKCECW